jgi:hypothetical protein
MRFRKNNARRSAADGSLRQSPLNLPLPFERAKRDWWSGSFPKVPGDEIEFIRFP